MTELVWQATCALCKARFPVEETEAHAAACEATSQARLVVEVERLRGWAFGIASVRELYVELVPGTPKQRRFEIRLTENPMPRAQLVAFRDLITLALDEAPEAVTLAAAPPVDPPVPTGSAA
jgi:hypothetical protein